MARPIYPYEMGDPDFSWLITNFTENRPEYCVVEDSCLPVVFISSGKQLEGFVPGIIAAELGDGELLEDYQSDEGEF